MVKPLELASSEPLPIAIERLQSAHSSEDYSGLQGTSPRKSLKQQLSEHVTPYQALPVQGPFVPEDQPSTPAYEVLEPAQVLQAAPCHHSWDSLLLSSCEPSCLANCHAVVGGSGGASATNVHLLKSQSCAGQ